MYTMTKFQFYLIIVLIFYSGLFITPGFLADNTNITKLDIHHQDLVSDEYQDILEAKTNDTILRFVSVIFRHGDRTPNTAETYSNDLYKNDNFYPVGRGQLTNVGKERSYQLGLLLRKLYDDFLGAICYQPHVYARSTFIARTKMTLQLVLAALFPPNNMQKWNKTLLWQPMNVIYGPSNEDGLMMPFAFPAYQKIYTKLVNSTEIKKKEKKYHDLMKNVSKYAGNTITDLYNLLILRQTIHVQLSMNLKLPKAAHILNADKDFFEAARLAFDLFIYNEELIRLSGGVLLRKIIEDMNKVINGTSDRKMNLFSGHDVNVAALLRALHIKNEIYSMPNFTSSVILELHEWKDKYFVKMLYYWGIPAKVETLSIPGCNILCPYDKFLNLTSTTTARDTDSIGPIHLEEDSYAF